MNTRPAPLSSSPSTSRFSAIAVRQTQAPEETTRTPASANVSLAQLEAGLVRIVGGRAAAAMVQRSRQLSSQNNATGVTPHGSPVGALIRLATTLLGESLASRLIHLGQPTQVEPDADPGSRH